MNKKFIAENGKTKSQMFSNFLGDCNIILKIK